MIVYGLTTDAAIAEQPNIVLIMVDDMGYGDPRCYNAESKIPTPSIDSLARGGMRFTDAHAPGPLCHLSRYGLLTGEYPFRAETRRWRTNASIKPGQMTIAGFQGRPEVAQHAPHDFVHVHHLARGLA